MKWVCKNNCAECCGIFPMSQKLYKKNKHVQQRRVEQLVKVGTSVVPMTVDGLCVFLQENKKCAIYDQRPQVCKNYGQVFDLPCPYLDVCGKKLSRGEIFRRKRNIDNHVSTVFEKVSKKGVEIKNE